ncbi:hypothetical protein WJX72_012126 [[Myrmecia] bisecta]|uniref:Uncharacterized protein n=1 Tax=[Myrmecia] bisecta TaxID=41462 RepID=A0AAW1R928_9CHLO
MTTKRSREACNLEKLQCATVWIKQLPLQVGSQQLQGWQFLHPDAEDQPKQGFVERRACVRLSKLRLRESLLFQRSDCWPIGLQVLEQLSPHCFAWTCAAQCAAQSALQALLMLVADLVRKGGPCRMGHDFLQLRKMLCPIAAKGSCLDCRVLQPHTE